MKRLLLICIMFILYFIIINYKIANAFIEKIDLRLADDELAIIFLNSDHYQSILLKDNDMTNLLALNIKSSKDLKKNVDKFLETKLDYIFLANNSKLDLDCGEKDILHNNFTMNNYTIRQLDNIIELTTNNYNLCIYDVGDNDNILDCDFVYFMNMDYQLEITEKLKAIFYEKNISNQFKENTYIKWIDNYELGSEAYNILKLSNSSYDIITIPIQN